MESLLRELLPAAAMKRMPLVLASRMASRRGLENEVLPMFHQRDTDGIPQRWVAMMRRSLQTNGPRFSAKRMLREYAGRIYPRP